MNNEMCADTYTRTVHTHTHTHTVRYNAFKATQKVKDEDGRVCSLHRGVRVC